MRIVIGISTVGLAGMLSSMAWAGTGSLNPINTDARVETSSGSAMVDDAGDYACVVGEYFSPGGSCYVLPFQLPTLPVGQGFTASDLRMQLFGLNGTPAPADLYGLGLSSMNNIAQTSDLPVAADYYQGLSDPNNTLIQSSYLTSASPVRTDPNTGPFIDTSLAGDAALANFLNAAYANGANAGKYVFFRVSYELDPIPAGFNSYNLLTADAGGANEKPLLSYTYGIISAGGPSQWVTDGAGDWNNGSNWSSGVPNSIGGEADFYSAITGPHTVYTDSAVTVGTLNFNNANQYVVTGAGSLTLQVSTGNAQVIVQAGTQKINLPLTIASPTTFNVSGGATLLIANPMTINANESVTQSGSGTVSYQSIVTLLSGATLNIANPTTANTLSLAATAAASIAQHTGASDNLLQLNNLSVTPGATLDLSNNNMIVHGGNLATITAGIKAGFSGGTWTGTGITSTTAAADSTGLTALGVMQFTAAGTFDGQPVSAGDVAVKYTYYGDADLSGHVDGNDYTLIDTGFGGDGTGWQYGDFNYDGHIDGSDYSLIDNTFNQQSSAGFAAQVAVNTSEIAGGSASVPEPASLGLLGIGAIGLMSRRCRRA
jgi:PEP-CTERM motif